jgi:outer membrane immunogenic protein
LNKLLWNGVSLIALASAMGACAAAARAADMPVKAFPVSAPPPAVYNWSGFYTGLNVGAAWGSYDPQTSTTPDGIISGATARVNAAGIQSINPLGFTGGSQAGYNWRWGNLVAGVETDFDYLHLNGAANSGSVRLGAATQVVMKPARRP